MGALTLQFSTSPAFASSIIRRLSHSPFSHVDIVLDGEGLLGASGPDPHINDPGGVRIRPFNAWPYLTTPKLARLTASTDRIAKAVSWARTQIGKPFDDSALWQFLEDQARHPPRDWRDPDQWFCAELVCRAIEVGGLLPYPLLVVKDRVSPGDLLLIVNPLMSELNIREIVSGNS